MTNDLSFPGSNPFEEFGRSANRGQFLKFSKGDYIGANDTLIPIGSEMVAAVDEIELGWNHWTDGKPDDERIVRLADGFKPPARSELGDEDKDLWSRDENGAPQDPWRQSWGFPMADRHTGEPYFFTTPSKGGEGAVKTLAGAYGKHMRAAPDEYPVIRLDVGSYPHPNKAYGRVKYPIFEVIGWVKKDASPGAVVAVEGPTTGPAPPPARQAPAHQRPPQAVDDVPFAPADAAVPW